MVTLKDLLRYVHVEDISGDPDVGIEGVSYDSRRVEKGHLFVCIRGEKHDGHAFASDAWERGAIAFVVERNVDLPREAVVARVKDSRLALGFIAKSFYGDPSSKMGIIGVTGTNGKTTTTYLVKSILEEAGYLTGILGTIQYVIGSRRLPAKHTTPESLEVQALLWEMVEAGVKYACMEVSSHALALRRVDGCRFRVGIFTNLSQDHLDFHRDMEGYFRAKERLFLPLSRGGLQAEAAAVNVDDPYGRRLAATATGKSMPGAIRPSTRSATARRSTAGSSSTEMIARRSA